AKISLSLLNEGVEILRFYYCPHAPEENCECRKPKPGMVYNACSELGLHIDDVYCVIGDKKSDIELAENIGVKSILVLTGYGRSSFNDGVCASYIAKDLGDAAKFILNDVRKSDMPNKIIFLDNIAEHKDLLDRLDHIYVPTCKAAQLIADRLRSGKRIFLCGNGGSAADAQHMAAELSGRFLRERKALDAIALSCNSSAITAIGNDFSFEDIFVRQIEAHGRDGDVLVAISTSGNSINILKAVVKANEMGLVTIALTGEGGGEVGKIANMLIDVPASSTPRIQEMHLLIEHTICEMIENLICDGDKE
ncbi:MAG: HAD-IIIA family hydrolase, partial [Synergistaceae bacterium]|nr:HAD-IIIA family hydrolase [Synergistaceae bacterium]